MPILNKISGWKPWFYAKTIRQDPALNYGFNTASAPFPPSYLPARAFWAETFAVHCLLPTPWVFWEDPWTKFMTGGGATGTLIGSLNGLALVGMVLQDRQIGEWGIGRIDVGIPEVGYCMGDLYKEHSYFQYTVLHLVWFEILAQCCIDVFQRSRLKRIYVIEGMVVRCVPDPTAISTDPAVPTTQYILTIDYEGVVPSGLPSINGDRIKVYKKDGSTVNITAKELKPNWEMVVTVDSDPSKVPESGDFYQMDKPWCVEDPFMMSGFWKNPESFGGLTLAQTTHILPYSDVEFTGFYIYREKDSGEITLAAPGSPFVETETHEWAWNYYTGKKSQIYNDTPDRYYSIEADKAEDPDFSGDYISPTMKKFPTASTGDLAAWKDLDGATFARMELNLGGNSARQNWHSPILTKCWFKQGGKYFAMYGQPDGNVVDIALRDVSNTASLTTDSGSGGTILNQYAWMINEHDTECGVQTGFLEGHVDSATYDSTTDTTEIVFKNSWNSYGTVASNVKWSIADSNGESFYKRFINTYGGSILKTMWKKFQYWRVFDQTRKSYVIEDPSTVNITPSTPITTTSETISKAKVKGDASGATSAGFYFDEPYKRYGALLLPVYTYEIKSAYDSNMGPLPLLCVDMTYRSAVMAIDLPSNIRIGSTGARWWGLGARGLGSILSNDNIDLFVTVPASMLGISSFYHINRQQDWIFYLDKDTDRVTLRRGNVNFTETPRRMEVTIGLPDYVDIISGGFPITFDSSRERVKLINVKLPKEGSASDDEFGPSAMTFQYDTPSDYFGFTSTGSGVFDFRALQANGHAPGTVDYSKYKAKGQFISPVYIYTKRDDDVSLHDYETLELGIDTKYKLYVKNGSPSDIEITYVKNRQTLHFISLFDAHHMTDGEVMVIYGKNTYKFTKDGTEVDPSDTANPWPTNECVFITGTADNSLTWGTPISKFLTVDGDSNYQYPVMIINACNYLASCYNDISERLILILKCYHKDSDGNFIPFIGAYSFNKMTIPTDLTICDADPDLNFWYRKSRCPSTILADSDKAPISPDINLDPSSSVGSDDIVDNFIRIIGPTGTSCSIEDEIDEIGVMSAAMLGPGTTVILYSSSSEGVRMLSSHDAVKWRRSRIILARDGESPFWMGGNLYYITPEGIKIKSDMDEYMNMASRATEEAGFTDAEIEEVQEKFDNARTLLIGSGRVNTQKISGHISHDGKHKIVYYNLDNILCCLESEDTFKWKMASNF
jgi:hypothetical protein